MRALEGPVLLVEHAHQGHDVNGGEVEIALVNLVVCRDDGVVSSDLFGNDDAGAMLAFGRLTAGGPESSRRPGDPIGAAPDQLSN